MSKMSEMAATIEELRNAATAINGAANWLTAQFGGDAEPETTAPIKEPPLTLEAVRAVLAEKSRSGHTAKVRELLEKHGAAKLSEIDPQKYAALLAEAEVLGNG